ncbi:uncharacterized protein [Rutidosis leptorrhynchoides]|uniref:uncharacterized protein n=1 Tax=Rutidosis leptorrhynchoides TaxID=125765 RepID=UPI003A99CF33
MNTSAADAANVTREGIGHSINWEWSRFPTGRTLDEFDSLCNLLQNFTYNKNKCDSWKWNLSSNGRFTVKRLSLVIEEQLLANQTKMDETIRYGLVPKKIELFTWRALKKRLPVRLELDKHGIDLHSVRCPLCDDGLESVDHTLFSCKIAQEVWVRDLNWWNRGNITSFSLNELIREDNIIWKAVIWVTSYLIRKNRNNKVFKNKCWNGPVELNEIQVCSFDWISRRIKGIHFDWRVWLTNPDTYLS